MSILNTISGVYGIANVAAKLIGGRSLIQSNGYRPSEWGHSGSTEKLVTIKPNIGGLFFDAIFNTQIETSLTATSHPTQLGANIADHAYVNPVRITMDIGMSDAMACYSTEGYAQGNSRSKSVNAYHEICKLQQLRIPLAVMTRLNTYQNMLITNISVNDDVNTKFGLRAVIQLEEMLVVNVGTEKVSARAWVSSGTSNKGQVQPLPIDSNSKTLAKIMEGG